LDGRAAIGSGSGVRYKEASGLRVSAVGLGTWQFGSADWGYGDDYARREAPAIVERALELGITLFDSAEAYGMGRSERILGSALANAGEEATADVVVATKVFPVLPLAPVVLQRAERSRARLGRTIDLYQLHWPNPAVPLSQQAEGLRRALDAGVIRFPGVSNYSASRWEAIDAELGRPLLSNQVHYSLAHRNPERGVLAYAEAHDRLVLAYSPLAQGFLSGRYDAVNRPTGGARRMNALFLPENLEAGASLIDALREVAAAHEATPAQVALAWLVRRPQVVVIPGASSVAQVESNAAAADLDLTDDEDARLTGASDAFHPLTGPRALVPLARQLVRG
jgi:aryl-alcohol dehydrogenase-like predicted oxidoreductase